MVTLFEYNFFAQITDPKSLRSYLHRIWQEQKGQYPDAESSYNEELLPTANYQPFLSFDGNFIRANNYVGFIQTNDTHLEIYPKVFRAQPLKPVTMLRHLFFWFDYCRKWKFPFSKTNLDTLEDAKLPELIIHLMASKMLETVSSLPISLYQSVEESSYTPKGKINIGRYLKSGFISGNHHVLECDHEPFLFDNQLNRAIKYTARVLLSITKFTENQNILQELIYILDEVDDQPCSAIQLDSVTLNPLFTEYADVKDICKIVLDQLIYSNDQYDLSQWSLLFPMEYIFEDFIAGFLQTYFSGDWKIEYQKSNLNLTTKPAAFQMQHDIFLTLRKDPKIKIIVDTKYKMRDVNYKLDKKKGISQNDLYQMTSYAFRRGCDNVLILYPNVENEHSEVDEFEIQSGFNPSDKINVTAAEVPFWSNEELKSLSNTLKARIAEILKVYL